MTPSHWHAVSRHADLGGDVHYLDFGGPAGQVPVVLVHGLGGSHLNWGLIGPALAARTRVYAPDLPGFGLTFPSGRSASVRANTAVLDAFLDKVVGEPALLVGNSMGGLISLRQAAARPESVTGLALLDPVLPRPRGVRQDRLVAAMFVAYLTPGLGPRMLARHRAGTAPARIVADTLALCCPDPTVIPPDLVEASVALVAERSVEGPRFTPRELDIAFLQAAKSVVHVAMRRGAYRDLMRSITAPVLLMHGALDRLVPVGSARAAAALCPGWTYHEYAGVGHVPMLEIPDEVVSKIFELLDAGRQSERTGSS